MSNQQPTPAQLRTQADDFNRLIAMAFEERVNAQSYAANLEQRLGLAAQMLEAERAKSAALQKKVDELTPKTLTEADAAADLAGVARPGAGAVSA